MTSPNPFVLRCEIKGLGDVCTANSQSYYSTVPDWNHVYEAKLLHALLSLTQVVQGVTIFNLFWPITQCNSVEKISSNEIFFCFITSFTIKVITSDIIISY